MAGQFIHIEAFALSGNGRKASAIGIIREAARVPSACRHISEPKVPNVCFGAPPTEVEPILKERIGAGFDRVGRTVSVSALVLLTAVTSWPMPTEVMLALPQNRECYADWKVRSIEFFQKLWGDALVSAVEHLDEGFPHLHFLAVPPLDPTGVLAVETISAPHRAQAEKRRAGGGRLEQRLAFRAAAVDLQDAYYASVGAPSSLDRVGPRRQRWSRVELLARRRAQEAERKALAEREAQWVRRMADVLREMDEYRSRCAAEATEQINADREANASLRRRAAEEIRRAHAENERLRQELQRLSLASSETEGSSK